MMIDANVQRAESARNATSSGQKVRKRSRFGSILAFNSSALNPPVVIYDLTSLLFRTSLGECVARNLPNHTKPTNELIIGVKDRWYIITSAFVCELMG